MSRQGRKGRTIAAAVAVAALGAFASGGPLDELLPRPRSIVPKDGVVMNGWGTDPAKRAFYRAFRDFNPLNDLGIG